MENGGLQLTDVWHGTRKKGFFGAKEKKGGLGGADGAITGAQTQGVVEGPQAPVSECRLLLQRLRPSRRNILRPVAFDDQHYGILGAAIFK